MKNTLLLFFVFFAFQVQSQLVSTTLLDSYSVTEIEEIASDLGVPNGVLPIAYGVDYYRIEYQTMHPNGESVLVSGGLALPQGITCPRPIASYQHGTTTERYGVPGYQNSEALLGVLYSSGGYVVTLPDYIGLGSSDLFHLYVHAESQASTGLDLIRLATEELNNELNYTWDGQLFLFGYSQGGHATMALHKSIEEDFSDEFTVTASAPMSGPYDISGAQTDYLLEDVPFSFSGFLPYVTIAYQNAYGNLYNSLDEIFIEPYASNLPDLFDGTNSIGYISSQLPAIPSQMLVPEVYEAFQTDPNHFLRQALEDNDVYDWAPTAPTRLYYCTEDEQVSFNNSLVALETMIANGSTSVDALNGGALDHGECAPLALLGGFFFFEDHYVPPFTLDFTFEVTDVSMAGANDGAVNLVSDQDLDEYTITWSNQTTGESIANVGSGSYTVVITNNEGCSTSGTAFVDVANNVNENQVDIRLIANPVDHLVALEWPGEKSSFELIDLKGKIIYRGWVQKGLNQFDVSEIPAGHYLARVFGSQSSSVQRIVIAH